MSFEVSGLSRNQVSELISKQAGKDLFQSVLERFKALSVVWDSSAQPARWSWKTEEIKLHPSLEKDPEKLQFFLIFELCNASRTHEFKAIQASNSEDFVEAVERIEYASLLETIRILATSRVPYLESFDEHYLFQQLQGHSARIAQEYHPRAVYKGKISSLNDQEKKILLACLKCKLKKDQKRFDKFYPYLPEPFKDLQFS